MIDSNQSNRYEIGFFDWKERALTLERLLNDSYAMMKEQNDRHIKELAGMSDLMEEQRSSQKKDFEEQEKRFHDYASSADLSAQTAQKMLFDIHSVYAANRLKIPKTVLDQKKENAIREKVCPIDCVTLLFDDHGKLCAEADHINGNRADNRPDNIWFISVTNHKLKSAKKISQDEINKLADAYLLRERRSKEAFQNVLPFSQQ